jgi:hypothetical protein
VSTAGERIASDLGGANGNRPPPGDQPDGDALTFLEWDEFWKREPPDREWALPELVPAGRQVAVYAKAKTGKSLIALDGAAARATGRSVFGANPLPAVDVIYIDVEMGAEDLYERLEDLGYGPDSDLSRLHYYQGSDLLPLDTDFGGQLLHEAVLRYNAALVVVDTMTSAVGGPENDSDTYRNFQRWTGRRLRAAGCALLRNDHSGKDPRQGQRGSSAKADDVDVVFMATRAGNLVTLKKTHGRIPWVATDLRFTIEDTPQLRHVLTPDALPEGAEEVAGLLDDIGVPVDVSFRAARDALKAASCGRRNDLVAAAVKYRRRRR